MEGRLKCTCAMNFLSCVWLVRHVCEGPSRCSACTIFCVGWGVVGHLNVPGGKVRWLYLVVCLRGAMGHVRTRLGPERCIFF